MCIFEKRVGYERSSTYRRDEARSFLVNFQYMIANHEEPFFFLPKHKKCFLMTKKNPLDWKIVLHKESCIHHVRIDTRVNYMRPDDNALISLNMYLITPHS